MDATERLAALYRTIKKYSGEVRNDRRLTVPPAYTVTAYSQECGSQLTLDARIEGGRICEIGYRVRACSLGQATTAILVQHAIGVDSGALRRVGDQFKDILAGRNSHCDWPELEVFSLAKEVQPRHGSALLPFHAMEQLFEQAAAASAT